ncbi:MAG: DUF427 domain-containing protein [Streptosporangiales bacterium]|nr:DUF427 domain-containing protein [Streptosporangiales bacterium]
MGDDRTDGVRVETSGKRLRAYLGGQLVFDTPRPALVWEIPYYPTYYVPLADVRAKLEPTGELHESESRGQATICDVVVDGAVAEKAASSYAESGAAAVRGLVRFDWNSLDHWLEEDEPAHVHPRDPYKRVDILNSSRHVVVSIDGVTVADSRQPRMLFETGLPTRYYLPLPDVRMDLLRPSDHHTDCPYKGTASYWHVEVDGTLHENIVWTYPAPTPESQKVIGLACFYDEKVDVEIDGVPQARPESPFS